MARRRHEEHANHERWLVSYADFITLLFAFFVVLYSASQVDKRKVGKLALAIQVAFQQMGVFPSSNTKLPLNQSEPMPFQDVQVIENVVRSQDLQRFVQPHRSFKDRCSYCFVLHLRYGLLICRPMSTHTH